MSEPVQVSILIPAFNEEQYLGATLGLVHASFRALQRTDYEIVVCNNNSTDSTDAVAQAGGARVVFEPHNAFSRARNAAARAATGEWFIFLDADTQLSPALLQATMDCLGSGRIGGGGALVQLDTQHPGWFGALFRWGWNRLSVIRQLAPGPYTFCLRRAWVESGGFDEAYYYCEDIFFSKKLRRWCRAHGLKMQIITRPLVVTSARKLQWYTTRQLLWQFLRLLVPNSIKRRADLPVWYARPPRKP